MKTSHPQSTRALMLAALGVVFGDIGTSPLYTLRECITATHLTSTPENILGILSAITWALIAVVTLKYVVFIMKTGNKGEGGIFALTALAIDQFKNPTSKYIILAMGLAGAALFYGDAVITPAISTLGAVEGLKVINPHLEPLILPLSIALTVGLFAIQKHGSGKVGLLFGPIMLIWFTALALLGLTHIVQHPSILWALNPAEFVAFATHHPHLAFVLMGTVVLAVTGGEALYADMGHFGAPPIRRTWMRFVFPALLLNYFGQGALLLTDPSSLENPFFHMVPDDIQLPMLLLATMASLIASQAVISGAFSLTNQAIQLGYLPRMNILHTSHTQEGQIVIPILNTLMAAAVIGIILGFKNSSALAAAYGIAVTGTMLITTLMATMVFRQKQGWSLAGIALFTGVFTAIDITFFTANFPKIPHGGFLPLVLGWGLFIIMLTWIRGRRIAHQLAYAGNPTIENFIRGIPSTTPKISRTAVFLTSDLSVVPPALLYNFTHNGILHEQTIIFTINHLHIPRCPEDERLTITFRPHGITLVQANQGFMETPNIPNLLNECTAYGLKITHPQQLSYILAHHTFVPSPNPALNKLEEPIFRTMDALALSAITFFHIPRDKVVEIGNQIDI